MPKRERPAQKLDPATRAFNQACTLLSTHPLFAPLFHRAQVIRQKNNYCPSDGWAVVVENGAIHAHPTRRGDPEEGPM